MQESPAFLFECLAVYHDNISKLIIINWVVSLKAFTN